MADEFAGEEGLAGDLGADLTLKHLASAAHPLETEPSGATPLMRLESADEIAGLHALVLKISDQDAVDLIVGGERVGYLQRAETFRLLGAGGFGDSAAGSTRGKLTGSGVGSLFKLKCPVPDCPDSPIYMASFNPNSPPYCTTHTDEQLQLVTD